MLENGKWAPTFPKARYLVGRLEFDFWSAYDDKEQEAMLGDSIGRSSTPASPSWWIWIT
jgi:hypothetical protein